MPAPCETSGTRTRWPLWHLRISALADQHAYLDDHTRPHNTQAYVVASALGTQTLAGQEQPGVSHREMFGDSACSPCRNRSLVVDCAALKHRPAVSNRKRKGDVLFD
jgi:hypothetical protein